MSLAGRISFINQILVLNGHLDLANGGSTGSLTLALLGGGAFSWTAAAYLVIDGRRHA